MAWLVLTLAPVFLRVPAFAAWSNPAIIHIFFLMFGVRCKAVVGFADRDQGRQDHQSQQRAQPPRSTPGKLRAGTNIRRQRWGLIEGTTIRSCRSIKAGSFFLSCRHRIAPPPSTAAGPEQAVDRFSWVETEGASTVWLQQRPCQWWGHSALGGKQSLLEHRSGPASAVQPLPQGRIPPGGPQGRRGQCAAAHGPSKRWASSPDAGAARRTDAAG